MSRRGQNDSDSDDGGSDTVKNLQRSAAMFGVKSTPAPAASNKNPFAKSARVDDSISMRDDDDESQADHSDDFDDDEEEEDDDDDDYDTDQSVSTKNGRPPIPTRPGAVAGVSTPASRTAAPSTVARPVSLPFDLTTFNGPFDASRFVSDLTRPLFTTQSASGQFDPAPFHVLFDLALAKLSKLRDTTDVKIRDYAAQCRRDEELHRDGLAKLQLSLQGVFVKFRRLDSKISAVAHTDTAARAAGSGHTLASVDGAKKANERGQEIIRHFLAFQESASAGGSRDKLPAIYSTTDAAELHDAAEMIQLLAGIASDLRSGHNLEKTAELIARTSNELENQLIARFESGQSRGDLGEMQRCARTLLHFRGRALVKRYVFNVVDALEAKLDGKESKDDRTQEFQSSSSSSSAAAAAAVEHPDSLLSSSVDSLSSGSGSGSSPLVSNFRSKLLRFYRCIVQMVRHQCTLCTSVFPQPLQVLKSILERVFQDRIQGRIEAILSPIAHVDPRVGHAPPPTLTAEEYLKVLEFAYTKTGELVQAIQADIRACIVANAGAAEGGGAGHERVPSGSSNAQAQAAGANDHVRTPSSLALGLLQSTNSAGNTTSSNPSGGGGGLVGEQVALMNLNDQLGGIFSLYRESYFARELALLQALCDRVVRETLALEPPPRTQAKANASVASDADDDTDMFGRLKQSIVDDQKQKWILLVLEAPAVDKILTQSISCIQRADRLCDAASLPDNIAAISIMIVTSTLEFIQVVMNCAAEFLPPAARDAEVKSEVDPFYFQVVGLVNLIIDKLQLHRGIWVSPRIRANPNTQIVADARVRELLVGIEHQICAGLVRCLSGAIKYIARIMHTKQKSSDYKPKEGDSNALLDGMPSAACASVCAAVKVQYDAAVTCLDGKNLDKFLTIFGLKLHDVLSTHLQKLVISTSGAGLLARDMKHYQIVMSSFHLPIVDDRWSELRLLVDLFFVRAEHLASVIADSTKLADMARTNNAYLLAFVQMRADYSDNKRKLLGALGIVRT